MRADLHTHTTASDGKLSPFELLQRARTANVDMLAITDHDSIAAYAELPKVDDLRLVPGVEFSTLWQRVGIHVVGLNVALDSAALREAIAYQHRARDERATRIAERLAKRGIADALAGAARFAGNGSIGCRLVADHGGTGAHPGWFRPGQFFGAGNLVHRSGPAADDSAGLMQCNAEAAVLAPATSRWRQNN